MRIFTFGYGSLLSPDSLRSTLPDAAIDDLVPAKVGGFLREWNVAFPNDGSQSDKAYFHANNERPPFVLFVNITAQSSSPTSKAVNGILTPTTAQQLEHLKDRELRYNLTDVTTSVRTYDERQSLDRGDKVYTFTGREEFVKQECVGRGVIQRNYVNTIMEGVSFWEQRCPGFERDFHASTRLGNGENVVDLKRVDEHRIE